MNRPAISRDKLVAAVRQHFTGELPALYVVAVPAYFMRSQGDPAKNDRNIYDDALFVVSDNIFAAFNGNTDPSVHRNEVATLQCPQTVWYRPGQHAIGKKTEHAAFRQDSPVIVHRDNFVRSPGFVHNTRGVSLGEGLWTDKDYRFGRFWTNLHKGGVNTTSSLGCLTVPPSQWGAFHALVTSELKRTGLKRFPCQLIPGPIN